MDTEPIFTNASVPNMLDAQGRNQDPRRRQLIF